MTEPDTLHYSDAPAGASSRSVGTRVDDWPTAIDWADVSSFAGTTLTVGAPADCAASYRSHFEQAADETPCKECDEADAHYESHQRRGSEFMRHLSLDGPSMRSSVLFHHRSGVGSIGAVGTGSAARPDSHRCCRGWPYSEMSRRVVRVDPHFFSELDRQFGEARGPNGEPSSADFLPLSPAAERSSSNRRK